MLTQYSYYTGDFTEYGSMFVYLSDFILFVCILYWILNKLIIDRYAISRLLSEMKKTFDRISNASIFKQRLSDIHEYWLMLAILVIWLLVNVIVNQNYKEIEIYQTLRIMELVLMLIFIVLIVKTQKFLNYCLFAISISGFFQSVIAIYQFEFQRSLFGQTILHKLSGESIISPSIPGVAKIVYDGEKILRAYGTFPHPNLLGGFLIFTIGISLYLILYNKRMKLSSYVNDDTKIIKSQAFTFSIFWIVIISVQFLALVFSFSRSAWLGFIIFLIMLLYWNYKRKLTNKSFIFSSFKLSSLFLRKITSNFLHLIVSRETISIFNPASANILKLITSIKKKVIINFDIFAIMVIAALTIFAYFPLINSRVDENLVNTNSSFPADYAITDRLFYNNVSRETISHLPLFGSGLGTYIFQINDYLHKYYPSEKFNSWQYQPNHMMYYLISSEIGLVGLLLYLLILIYILKIGYGLAIYDYLYINAYNNVSRETLRDKTKRELTILKNNGIAKQHNTQLLAIILFSILCSFIFIGLVDHYFWTLQQGRMMFWLVISLIITIYYHKNKI